jgi:hypothetical protein
VTRSARADILKYTSRGLEHAVQHSPSVCEIDPFWTLLIPALVPICSAFGSGCTPQNIVCCTTPGDWVMVDCNQLNQKRYYNSRR